MSKRWEIFWLVICTLGCMAAALVSMVVVIIAPIVFDRQGSLLNPIAWIAFLMMITLWVVCILAPFGAWVMFTRQKSQMAWTLMATPPIWAGVMALMLIFLPG